MQARLSTIGLLMMVGALLGMIALDYALSPALVVIALQACAGSLMLWARLTFGMRSFHATADPTSGGLVTKGPYAYIRHPIYTAICLFMWPPAIARASWASVGLAAVLTAGAIVRMLCEESLLAARYPEYAAYAANEANDPVRILSTAHQQAVQRRSWLERKGTYRSVSRP